MASPPIPPLLDYLAARPFSFYPAIVNIEHNEWLFRKATWSEILVVNRRTGEEIWISRRFVGEVSRIDEPVLIVGLSRELELKGGMIVPFQRRIIEMPVVLNAAVSGRSVAKERNEPAPVVGIRLERSDRGVFRLILIAAAPLVALCVAAVVFTRVGELRQKNVMLVGTDQSYLSLNGHDDFVGVTQKLGGTPATDRSEQAGTILFRALGYPGRRYTVILMGTEKGSMFYIGTMNRNWRPIHSVDAHAGALLRGLERF
jgi:hypothetical protein